MGFSGRFTTDDADDVYYGKKSMLCTERILMVLLERGIFPHFPVCCSPVPTHAAGVPLASKVTFTLRMYVAT